MPKRQDTGGGLVNMIGIILPSNTHNISKFGKKFSDPDPILRVWKM